MHHEQFTPTLLYFGFYLKNHAHLYTFIGFYLMMIYLLIALLILIAIIVVYFTL